MCGERLSSGIDTSGCTCHQNESFSGISKVPRTDNEFRFDRKLAPEWSPYHPESVSDVCSVFTRSWNGINIATSSNDECLGQRGKMSL